MLQISTRLLLPRFSSLVRRRLISRPGAELRTSALLLVSLPLVAGAMPLPQSDRQIRALAQGPKAGAVLALNSSTPAAPAPQPGEPADAIQPALAVATSPRSRNAPYRITPERRALLNTIRYAEGTWLDGSPNGYRVIYGGGLVSRLDRHPRITVSRGYVSAAAGAYQFLPRTWDAAAARLGFSDFSPEAQDQAALHLIEQRGALASFDRQGLSADVLARLAPEWASLPSAGGGSYYGQPVKGVQELQAFYQSELGRQRDLARAGGPMPGQA
jgi:lysozyme